MKLPRNVSGATLQAALRRLGYDTVRQRGSHVRITTQINGEHHEVIPLAHSDQDEDAVEHPEERCPAPRNNRRRASP